MQYLSLSLYFSLYHFAIANRLPFVYLSPSILLSRPWRKSFATVARGKEHLRP